MLTNFGFVFLLGFLCIFGESAWVHNQATMPDAPANCPNPEVNFFLYTRKTGMGRPERVDDTNGATISAAPWAGSCLKVLFHGYTTNHLKTPSSLLAPVYLEKCSVLSADYASAVRYRSSTTGYPEAVANVPRVSRCLARTLSLLFDTGRFAPNATELIGFSLGAHVAGAVASHISPSYIFPRITGLDPAGPIFDALPYSSESKLSPHDADCVFVLHTSAGYEGTVQPLGDTDFYAYGGNDQPGCHGNTSCDHNRAPEYWRSIITGDLSFWGHAVRGSKGPTASVPLPATCSKRTEGVFDVTMVRTRSGKRS